MVPPMDAPEPLAPEPPAVLALALYGAGFLAFPLLGGLAQLANLPFGLLWTEAFLFFLPAWLLVSAFHGRPSAWLRLGRPRAGDVALGSLVGLANYPLASSLEALVRLPVARAFPEFAKRSDISASTLGVVHGWQLGVLVLAVGLAAPLGEEVAFRGLLQPTLTRRLRPGTAVVLTAALFAIIHWEPIGALARTELGMVFGLLVLWSGSLWSSVAAHAANNLFATALYAFASATAPEPDPHPLQLLAISGLGALLTAPLLYAAWRRRRAPAQVPWTPPVHVAAKLRTGLALALLSLALLIGVTLATGSFGAQMAR
jgi:membrane protease YdiL (CAAX protease family)